MTLSQAWGATLTLAPGGHGSGYGVVDACGQNVSIGALGGGASIQQLGTTGGQGPPQTPDPGNGGQYSMWVGWYLKFRASIGGTDYSDGWVWIADGYMLGQGVPTLDDVWSTSGAVSGAFSLDASGIYLDVTATETSPVLSAADRSVVAQWVASGATGSVSFVGPWGTLSKSVTIGVPDGVVDLGSNFPVSFGLGCTWAPVTDTAFASITDLLCAASCPVDLSDCVLYDPGDSGYVPDSSEPNWSRMQSQSNCWEVNQLAMQRLGTTLASPSSYTWSGQSYMPLVVHYKNAGRLFADDDTALEPTVSGTPKTEWSGDATFRNQDSSWLFADEKGQMTSNVQVAPVIDADWAAANGYSAGDAAKLTAEEIAVHEAGHAMAFLLCGVPLCEVWIKPDAPPGENRGRASWAEDFYKPGPTTPDVITRALTAAAAGVAAVALYLRANGASVEEAEKRAALGGGGDEAHALQGAGFLVPDDKARQEQLASDALRRCKALLNPHGRAVQAIARELLKRHRLTADEVRQIVARAEPATAAALPQARQEAAGGPEAPG